MSSGAIDRRLFEFWIAATACFVATAAQAQLLDDATRSAFSGRPLQVIHHQSPVFDKRTLGKTFLSFAGAYAGGIAAAGVGAGVGGAGTTLITTYADGGAKVEYRIEDPGVEIARQLAARMAHHLAASSCQFVETPVDRGTNSAREYKEIVPDGTLVLEVRTTGWGIVHRLVKMTRYFVFYGARARLFDPATNRTVAGTKTPMIVKSANKEAEFTRDELFADDAKLLKSELAANVPVWVDRLFAELTGAGTVGLSECRPLADAATPVAAE